MGDLFQIPDLIDNRKVTTNTLGEILNLALKDATNPTMDVATAFFNLDALRQLKGTVENVSSLRLLIGKEQDQAFVLTQRLYNEIQQSFIEAREGPLFEELNYWQDFLKQERVQIRLYDKTFLHGKAYILEGLPYFGRIGIIGSSNFTGGGLLTNLELNAVLKQEAAVNELKRWFEDIWAESSDYKAEILQILSQFTRRYSPYEIYMKVLYEAYRDRFEGKLQGGKDLPSPIALADFQHDGYLAAKEILENYGGVLIADSVGLGKSFLTLRLLEDYAYRERQTVLVICPAALIDTVWRPLLQRYGIPHELLSMEKLSQSDFCIADYSRFKLLVVDESHNFRNPNSNRWENIFRLLSNGSNEKKLILLTATPINNKIFDLYHQLRLITRDQQDFFASVNIPDLLRYFIEAEEKRDKLYEILEAIAVRRSRIFIKKNYPDAIIDGQKIHFPERRLHAVSYSLEESYGKQLYEEISFSIENLLLAPYQIDTYRKEVLQANRERMLEDLNKNSGDTPLKKHLMSLGWNEAQINDFFLLIGRQTALANIMRILYLKRLESSVEALRISLDRQLKFQRAFLSALDQGRLLDSRSYRKWLQIDSTDEQVETEVDLSSIINNLPPLDVDKYDLSACRKAVETDIQTLDRLLEELNRISVEQDDKLLTLKETLNTPEIKGKKVIVFTSFRDTAKYIFRNLKSDLPEGIREEQIQRLDSSIDPQDRKNKIIKFAPRANNREDTPPEDQIQILISTDVLSEGQNLQDADTVINYDLHWNPVRLVQRIGRLDRIGSPHQVINVFNFFPEDSLEKLLGLLKRLYEKLEAINRSVGLDASVLGEMPNPMDFNTLRRIAQNDESVLDDLEAQNELTAGEELLQDLLSFIQKASEEVLNRIPLGVGTVLDGKGDKQGFFAAFHNKRNNQHYWLFEDEKRKVIIEKRLEAINQIRCHPDDPPLPFPEGFSYLPHIEKLREHLFKKLNQIAYRLSKLPSPQNQIVNWLHTYPSSAERNELLAYFERPVTGLALRELRTLWKDRGQISERELIQRLLEVAQAYPHPGLTSTPEAENLYKSDLECIAWVLVKT